MSEEGDRATGLEMVVDDLSSESESLIVLTESMRDFFRTRFDLDSYLKAMRELIRISRVDYIGLFSKHYNELLSEIVGVSLFKQLNGLRG